ncbi:hypothetical protein [Inediibacterium massiliense]|uniref:hypothetical protein n=1 Tax=Inediibacterium massiliense TaxID=1658111 RepID=UPI0006B448AD|nr:hypothetical protein [Inediibacterium massiliense]
MDEKEVKNIAKEVINIYLDEKDSRIQKKIEEKIKQDQAKSKEAELQKLSQKKFRRKMDIITVVGIVGLILYAIKAFDLASIF